IIVKCWANSAKRASGGSRMSVAAAVQRAIKTASMVSFLACCSTNLAYYALPNSRFDFSRDFALFVKLRGRFDTRCSRFHLLDRRCGELLLVDRFGVAGDLAQAGVTGDGRNLVRGAACLS